MEIKKITVGDLQTNCYLLLSGGEAAIVDPGDEPQKIIEEIKKTGAAVKFIINTHNHFDHIGANGDLKKEFNAKILINKNDAAGVAAGGFLEDGDVLKIGDEQLKIVKTPGHTKGGVCLFGDGFAVSGDTLFGDGIGRMDLPGGSSEEMAASLEKLDRIIPDGFKVYPGHGDIFTYRKGMALEYFGYSA